jgi:glycosyltransferase involved in cell wall biosynthesis
MSGVDIVVPCYKYGAYLRGCVSSLLNQEAVDVRVLIIDDCSPDNTPEVGQALVRADRRVEYRRHAVNKGHIATYNEGLLEWASSDYSVLISPDDLLIPGALKRAVGLMDANAEIGFTYGRAHFLRSTDPSMTPPPGPGTWRHQLFSGPEFIDLVCRSTLNPVVGSAVVVRTSLQHRIGGYRPELPVTGDLEMWLRFAAHGSVGFIDAEQAYYRSHPASMHNGYSAVAAWRHKLAAYERVFSELADRIPNPDRLERLGRETMATMSFWVASKAFEEGRLDDTKQFLDFALEADPTLEGRPEWARLQWKRRMGPRLWRMFRPLLATVRPSTAAASAEEGRGNWTANE